MCHSTSAIFGTLSTTTLHEGCSSSKRGCPGRSSWNVGARLRFDAHMLSVPYRAYVRELTLSHLSRTDWSYVPTVHVEPGAPDGLGDSLIAAYLAMLRAALEGEADLVLFLEDDLRFNQSIRHNLQNWIPLASMRRDKPVFASLVNPGVAVRERKYEGNYFVADPKCYYSSQAYPAIEADGRLRRAPLVGGGWLSGFSDQRSSSADRPAANALSLARRTRRILSGFGRAYVRADDFRPDWRC